MYCLRDKILIVLFFKESRIGIFMMASIIVIVSSLSLEHQEGFVVAVEQVKEEYPRCLVCDG